MWEFLESIDTNILLFFNSFHSDFFDNFMMIVTRKYTWVPFYVALAYMLFRNQGWRRAIFWLLGIGLTIALADQLCASVIRPQVERLRPSNELNPVSGFLHLVNEYRAHGFSFPSCHGANSAALATIICLIVRRRDVRWLICTWALLHVYSRIYLGVHYPGDIFVGIIIGALCGCVVYYVVNLLLIKFRLNVPEDRKEPDAAIIVEQRGDTLSAKGIVLSQSFVPYTVFLFTLVYAGIMPAF